MRAGSSSRSTPRSTRMSFASSALARRRARNGENMKKASSRPVDPSATSLREMPEIDFDRYHIRKNPYAAVIAREGISVVHDGPSIRSLAEIPEVDVSRVHPHRSAYAGRARSTVLQLRTGRGRPRRGQEIGPTPARSVRLPLTVWAALEAAAHEAGTTVHGLLRLAVTHLLQTQAVMEHLHAASSVRQRGQRSWARARSATVRRRAGRARPRR